MNFKQLVFRNVYRNRRTYFTYFLSSLFSVMVFFIFSLLYFHPQLAGTISSSSYTISFLAKVGMIISQIVIVLMSFVFLWYTFTIFLKSRKRDFSVYLMMGMRDRDLRKMIFFENLILGASSTITGLVLGIIFSKLILLISQNLLSLDSGLSFYLPFKPILLTTICFFVLFLLISIFTTITLQTENLAELTKSDDKPRPEPVAKRHLVILSLFLLVGGYTSVYLFASGLMYFSVLFTGVIMTILGTYLLFHQISIRVFGLLRKNPVFYKQGNMLTISNLIFRMKDNATMYFLIVIAASVAFVGIATTMTIGGGDFASTQDIQFAYVYHGQHRPDLNLDGDAEDQKNIEEISSIIRKGGFSPTIIPIDSKYLGLPQTEQINQFFGSSDWSIIPMSQYDKLAKEVDLPKLTLENDNQVLLFSNSNLDVKKTKEQNKSAQSKKIQVQYADGLGEKEMSIKKIPETLLYGYTYIGVVSDRFFDTIEKLEQKKIDETRDSAEPYDGTGSRATIIHYPEWQSGGRIDQKINDFLSKKSRENQDLWEAIGDKNLAEVPVSERPYDFYLNSLYQVWQETRQANGLILMISVLLGSVFFTFAACILYFRLFGELEQDGEKHRALYILGVPTKIRHSIVTRELVVMYFIPILVATIHFIAAMISLNKISGLSTVGAFFKILSIYLIFQSIFFIISRKFYLKHLDKLAEKN